MDIIPQCKIVPILEPEFVADSAVNATLANQEMCLLPWWSMFLIMLKVVTVTKPLLPSPAPPPHPRLHEAGHGLRLQLLQHAQAPAGA